MERTDVAVVGGGPAGTSAGRAAARQGADTVVVERGVPREDREGLGPDSTDAAGMLDYWVDLMELPEAVPEDVICQRLDGATFAGPTERITLRETGMESSSPDFGFTFDRARFDDWLGERCVAAGADYRVGTSVREVDIDRRGIHTLLLRDGHEIETEYLILADGPQRTVTRGVLAEFVAERRLENLASNRANHIAYQEYRKFPPELFDDGLLKFWWGVMPGRTAYPWVFPNDDCVARVGLTMPIGLDLDAVSNPADYRLLEPDDETVPSGKEYVERLLASEYPEYDLTDFPLVESRGKRGGTETYPISSTRPIDSPTGANVAIVGGAMGATSAFHEGGDHVAVRTGKIAGSLAGAGALGAYNREWKRAVGDEILRNVAMADVVAGAEPADWDRTLHSVGRMIDNGRLSTARFPRSGRAGLSVLARYKRAKFDHRNGGYVQLRKSEYAV